MNIFSVLSSVLDSMFGKADPLDPIAREKSNEDLAEFIRMGLTIQNELPDINN